MSLLINNRPNPNATHGAGESPHSPRGDALRAALLPEGVLRFGSLLIASDVRNGAGLYPRDFGALPRSERWTPGVFQSRPVYPGITYLAMQGGFSKPQPWERD